MRKFIIALLVCLASAAPLWASDDVAKYPDGTTQYRVPLDTKGERNGEYVSYFEGGKKVEERSQYVHGKLQGARVIFDANGLILKDEFWSQGKMIYGKSMRQIEAMRTQLLKEAAADVLKLGTPTNPHAPNRDQLARALGSVRFYRYLADIPPDVSYDDDYINQCQYGAELLAKINMLSHNPPRPPGMDDKSYKIGHDACGRSNIFNGGDIIASVDAYMNDSDNGNIDRLGHRRWVLNPAMGKTGFGMSGRYCTMYSFDHSREVVPDYQFVAFPPPGLCPVNAFKPSMAWLLTLNPAHYAKLTDSVQVAIWPIDINLNRAPQPLELNYRHVNTDGYGVPNALIFRPKTLSQRNALYEVVVSGIKDKEDQPAEVSYFVSFY